MPGPLDGLRVVDCSLGTAGPQASGLLSDYGAEVVWIEPPGGDPARARQPAAASVFNRGKLSVTLDPAKPEDRAQLIELIARADVFIQSWRPGEAEALGLAYDQLHARSPHLVYCAMTGFGEDGRWRDLPPYEPLVHALLGTMAYQAGRRDRPIFEALPFATTGAAQLAVIGILAALYRRLDDGFGRRVETSLLDGALVFHSLLWGESEAALATGTQRTPDNRTLIKPSTMRMVVRAFRCSDGEYVSVHTGAVGAFGRLMRVLKIDDRIKPSESGLDLGTPLPPEDAEILEEALHEAFAKHPRDEWVRLLTEADICAVEVFRPTAAFDQAQTRHNGMVVQVQDPLLGAVEQVAPPIRLGDDAAAPPRPAPLAGANTQQVLAGLDGPAPPSGWLPNPPAAAPVLDRPLLEGVRILDFGAYYAGPYTSRLLADLGADVLKIETVAGDPNRGIERVFFSGNAGKRSLAVNLKDAALRPAIERLLQDVDAVHHNMRPGAAERLGLGREQVHAVNPEVIYGYAPGWGSAGPCARRQSFAPLMSAHVGSSYEVAGQGNEPMPSLGNEDPGNGLLGAIGLLMALLERRRNGRVLYCETPQLNAALGMIAHIVRGADGQPIGAGALDADAAGVSALESLYRTADGWVCLVAREDREIRAVESRVGVEILSDARFADIPARLGNRDALSERLASAFASRTTSQWLDAFADAGGVLVEPGGESAMHDMLNDPQHRGSGRIAEGVHPEKGAVREVGDLIRVSGAAKLPHRFAPGLGEHSERVLLAAGCTPEELEALRARGSLAGPQLTPA